MSSNSIHLYGRAPRMNVVDPATCKHVITGWAENQSGQEDGRYCYVCGVYLGIIDPPLSRNKTIICPVCLAEVWGKEKFQEHYNQPSHYIELGRVYKYEKESPTPLRGEGIIIGAD